MKLRKFLILLPILFTESSAYADFGCHFVVNARLATAIDRSDKELSFRFTSQSDMDLIALSFYCEKAQTPPAYLDSLREDVNGQPSSQILESSTITPKEAGWMTVPMNEVLLTKGKVYHLVIQQDLNRGGEHSVGIIGPQNFASFAYSDVLNPFYPQKEKADPKLNVLVFENGIWKVLNQEPLFALFGGGHVIQGNPYNDFQSRPIHGNGTPNDPSDDQLQGECLHPHCFFKPTGFVIRVRKQGHPDAPLNYRVYSNQYLRHTTSLVYSGEALIPEAVSTFFQWVTIGIKKGPGQDFPPECRYVVFQTNAGRASNQAPGCEDCYLLSDVGNSGGLATASDLTFDGGAHLSRAAYSIDGGATWIDQFERDANVIILGPDCSSTAEPVDSFPNPLPTPESLWRGLFP